MTEVISLVQRRLLTLEFSVVPLKDRHPVETIVLKDKNAQTPLPCVSMIHGGPHGAFTTAFNATSIALALEGCKFQFALSPSSSFPEPGLSVLSQMLLLIPTTPAQLDMGKRISGSYWVTSELWTSKTVFNLFSSSLTPVSLDPGPVSTSS